MIFPCPQCQMQLKAEPEAAGKLVRCPGCGNRFPVPHAAAPPPSRNLGASLGHGHGHGHGHSHRQRTGWIETDPTNPNLLISFGMGFGLFVIWILLLLPFNPAPSVPVAQYSGMNFLASLFYKHMLVSFTNTLFFMWAISILILKVRKLRHQREALLLDVLPTRLGRQIDAENVGIFIDHVYNLPVHLRDSLMVNRIRKGLELFEIRQNSADVSHMMESQSNIDSARIGGSYSLLKAFLWAIPILGFIGTVLGLSHAIGGMNFANVEDVSKIVNSINNVTSGLGTAFDATLLGLVLAMFLNFPMNSLAKREDDNLNDIDAFCNEELLPRLRDSISASGNEAGALADSLVQAITAAQREFLVDLNDFSARMNDYAANLDARNEAFQQTVTNEFVHATTEMRAEMQETMRTSLETVSHYMGALESGIRSLNTVLGELGGKQIVIQQVEPKKKGWFKRG